MALALLLGVCTRVAESYGRAVSQVEYPRMLDERAGAAAVVAAEELHIDGA